MGIQEHLSELPEPFSRFHTEALVPDSYSRKLDHEVNEWEQPYGYDVSPMTEEGFEKFEHSFDKGKQTKSTTKKVGY